MRRILPGVMCVLLLCGCASGQAALDAGYKLRNDILNNYQIDNLLHLGPRTFDELSGEVVQNASFVITNNKPIYGGYYYRLVDEKNCSAKEKLFLNSQNTTNVYRNIPQSNFKKIPGLTIGYWVSQSIIDSFSASSIDDISYVLQGMIPGNVPEFVRNWFEVSPLKIGFNHKAAADILEYGKKWFLYNKGGGYRRWYGNIEHVLNMENNGYDIKYSGLNNNYRLRDPEVYFKSAVTWSKIGTGNFSTRYMPEGCLFDIAGCCIFNLEENEKYVLGLTNSKIVSNVLTLLSPTLNYEVEHIKNIPVKIFNKQIIEQLVSKVIDISREDWDAHEASWNFQENELVKLLKEGLGTISSDCGETTLMKYSTLNLLYAEYVAKWEKMFRELHANEEELNRQFIEIYGLQDELTPDVPLDEVTILQQGEIKIENNQLQFQRDVVIKQLISYAVGCWMGRYRLDKPGLHIAHPSPTADEICTYTYGNETLTIDDDGNIPLLPRDCPFDDNLQNRIADFVRIAFGADSLAENLNFIEQSLGYTIEKYLDKDFWKDHKKMYSNRPIYWLWSSKKGAFRVLSYMHRMDAYTAERIRSKYLLPYIEFLLNKINELSNRSAGLSTADSRKLDNYRKILEECQEYHERLQVVAEQAIGFDLDDGAVVNYAKFGDVLSKIK